MSINRILADLGKAVDSSSTGNFLNKEASGAEFNPVQWSDINSAPTILDSALASAIIDSAYVQARQSGVGSGGIDSATTIALIDSSYVGARASTGGSGFVKYQYTATASQTTFQDSDANGNVLSYDADYILVHYNGVLLPSADYTATDGSSVVLATGADSGSIIGIAKWGAAAGSSSGGSAGIAWGGDRGVYFGGAAPSNYEVSMDYWDITTPGNATDFGDLTKSYFNNGAVGDGTYGVTGSGRHDAGGSYPVTSSLDYITIATAANASNFGNTTQARYGNNACGDGTYGIFCGGNDLSVNYNTIDYITVASPGNATDFGDMDVARTYPSCCADATYGVIAQGYTGSAYPNNMVYVTIATPGNASTFGNTTGLGYNGMAGCSDATRGLFAGGYSLTTSLNVDTVEYITIATPGNSTDFGNLSNGRGYTAACSNDNYATISGGTGNVNTMDYFTIQTPSNATDFGDLTIGRASGSSASGSPS